MRTSQTIGALAKSLAIANTQIKNPNLDSVNPHFKNRYASLGAILNAIRVPFAAQGLSLVQSINTDNGVVSVETTVMHTSGEFIAETVSMPFPERSTVQTLGSICTYLRRYSAAAMAGIVGEEDEDGEQDRQERASSPAKAAPTPAKAAPTPRPIETVEAVKAPARPAAPADAYPRQLGGSGHHPARGRAQGQAHRHPDRRRARHRLDHDRRSRVRDARQGDWRGHPRTVPRQGHAHHHALAAAQRDRPRTHHRTPVLRKDHI